MPNKFNVESNQSTQPDDDQADIIKTTPVRYAAKTIEAIKLLQAGIPADQALMFTNQKKSISPQSCSELRQKAKRYSLTHPSTVKMASNQLKRILKGESRVIEQQKVSKDGEIITFNETIPCSDSHVMSAVDLVYSRYEPSINRQAIDIQVTHAVDLTKYANKAIDV